MALRIAQHAFLCRCDNTTQEELYRNFRFSVLLVTLYTIYTIEQTSSNYITYIRMLAGRASSSSQFHRVNEV